MVAAFRGVELVCHCGDIDFLIHWVCRTQGEVTLLPQRGNAPATTLLSQRSCHNDRATMIVPQRSCHNPPVTTIVPQRYCHKGEKHIRVIKYPKHIRVIFAATTLLTQRSCHNARVTTLLESRKDDPYSNCCVAPKRKLTTTMYAGHCATYPGPVFCIVMVLRKRAADEENDDLSCIVCFEVPCKDVYQCLNGHLLCSECLGQYREHRTRSSQPHTCPLCRISMVKKSCKYSMLQFSLCLCALCTETKRDKPQPCC